MALLVFLILTPNEATRILDEEEENFMMMVVKKQGLILQSLQKGPVTPSGPNGCNYVPGRGGAPCTSQRTFAGHGVAPPNHAYPGVVVPFGVATENKPQ
ncbi:hypothetical protein JCGZ_05747 [Jatropha curcas]|uniref:Uncharacterized protein n=1 Tax=Jatropha curcas TaxID=180498 RepID=A0A067LI70_JATCU|nr:hypothetical protein JCGZ_05747 [Jatropha curcas]